MRLPIIPFIVATTLLLAVVFLFTSLRSENRVLGVPKLGRLADIEGTETEVAIAPDGNRYAVIVSGDLWLLDLSTGNRQQITRTPELESFPDWAPDGLQLTFTRGPDTFVFNTVTHSQSLFRANATSLAWSSTRSTAFIRNRALWVANPDGREERQLVEADTEPDVTIEKPRFSPNALQIAFIKTQLHRRGELWTVDVVNGMPYALVADRTAENPMDVGWIMDGNQLIYLTNRAGSYSLWHIDLSEMTILPLTQPLFTIPLTDIGMSVWKDRIVLPRHFIDSNVVVSDGTSVAATEKLELEPACSPDGKLVAYTVIDDGKSEIWTAGIHGENPTFRALGREPRFSPSGYEVVYTRTDLDGNDDIWRTDIRNASTERLTDADEIDFAPDPSPDGRSIVFSSSRGGAISVWTLPAAGGKRLRINDAGYAPRYSPDSRSIVYWMQKALWVMDADGENIRQIFDGLPEPTQAVWTSKGPAFVLNGQIQTPTEKLLSPGGPIWPTFDVLQDGRFVTAPIDIRETSLWKIDLTYKQN